MTDKREKAADTHPAVHWDRIYCFITADGQQWAPQDVKFVLINEHLETKTLMEEGRKLASEREDLIASGVDPSELEIPLAPIRPEENKS